MKYYALLTSLAFLSACSGDVPPPTTDISDMETFTIRATGDIHTPVSMVDAAFVANAIASWASQIILLSEDGDIWRTNSDGEDPLLIAKGNYTDIHGLDGENGAGVFLAAHADGRASAFIERDDIGNFKPMTVSQGPFSVKTFCNGGGDNTWFIDTDGDVKKLNVTINQDVAIELSSEPTPQPPRSPLSCAINKSGDLFAIAEKADMLFTYIYIDETWAAYEGDIRTQNLTWLQVEDVDIALGLVQGTESMGLLTGGKANTMTLDDGLSIRGLEKADFIAGTDARMGSAYNEGIVMMGDAKSDRIVLLSLDYMGRVLETREQTQ